MGSGRPHIEYTTVNTCFRAPAGYSTHFTGDEQFRQSLLGMLYSNTAAPVIWHKAIETFVFTKLRNELLWPATSVISLIRHVRIWSGISRVCGCKPASEQHERPCLARTTPGHYDCLVILHITAQETTDRIVSRGHFRDTQLFVES